MIPPAMHIIRQFRAFQEGRKCNIITGFIMFVVLIKLWVALRYQEENMQ
jgi:hypothetical protein